MKVLVIEDNLDHIELIVDAFESIKDLKVRVIRANTLAQGVKYLISDDFDLCLCDLQLPDSSIANTVEWLSQHSYPLPMVILTSLNSLDVADELLNNGVQDYIAKSELTSPLLHKTCHYALERFKHQRVVAAHNQDMQAFCSSLSHDFKGHINRIRGVSKALKSELVSRIGFTAEEQQWFTYLEKSTEDIDRLVENLQSYLIAGYVDKKFELVDVKKVILEVIDAFNMALGKNIEVFIPDSIPLIHGNSALLEIVFHNLIGNSLKFNNNTPEITISANTTDNIQEISIQDNGIGFNAQQAERIFQPFYRLESGKHLTGSGLGLSIVKRIMDHHNGEIEVHSQEGIGSCFTLKLIKPS